MLAKASVAAIGRDGRPLPLNTEESLAGPTGRLARSLPAEQVTADVHDLIGLVAAIARTQLRDVPNS